MNEELKNKVKKWEEWCEFDGDTMNDLIREFFSDELTKNDLFEILQIIKSSK